MSTSTSISNYEEISGFCSQDSVTKLTAEMKTTHTCAKIKKLTETAP